MKAECLYRKKLRYADGHILEVVVWKVPRQVEGSQHNFKYHLFYGNHDQRLVAYDNEQPKGDHRHYQDQELPYNFLGIDQLLADFQADVEKLRQSS